MHNNFTTNDLIALLYNELDTSRRLSLYEALEEQPALMAEYQELMSAKQQLPKALFSPSDKAISNILAHGQRHTLV
ncbi:MAG: hypothetical protein AAGI23_11740 [Bacteroidota bacterium]